MLAGWQKPIGESPSFICRVVRCENGFTVSLNGRSFDCPDEASLLAVTPAQCHLEMASCSSDFLFVHCGVASSDDRLCLFPGRSYCGKSTLIKELVRCGWRYYSDEFAVIDLEGLVHAFPRQLSLRFPAPRQVQLDELGWSGSPPPLPVSAVFLLDYTGECALTPSSSGLAMLKVFDNVVSAERLGVKALHWLKVALDGVPSFEGTRGDVGEFAGHLEGLLINGKMSQ